MSEYNAQGYELDWDSEIENDGPEYTTLPEGEYDFTVVGFERQRYTPSAKAKLPPCNMAVVSLQFKEPEGSTTIKDKLYLHSSVEWRLCAFFTSIGQRQHGERVRMNWNAVIGAHGRAKLSVRTYTDNNGKERTINDVDTYLDRDVFPESAIPQQQAQAPSAPPQQMTFQAGKF